MTKNATKRALLMSALAILCCLSMLIGSTFAWFTDEVKSVNNKIVAGNLDVELEWSTDAASWAAVEEGTNVFSDELWEPGHTEVVYLKVKNAGTLALKYQLGVNVYSETLGTNAAGDAFRLSDYIHFGVVETGTKFTNRDAAIAAVTAPAIISKGFSKSSALDASGEEYVALVVYMPTSVGNEANYKTGTAAPVINLGINLFATQVVKEEDSFGNNYDDDALYADADYWDGTVPAEMPDTLVVDGTTKIIHVKDAAAFAYLSSLSKNWRALYTDGNGSTYTNYANGAGAQYYYRSQWTVSLEADIDLGNQPIDPVVLMFGENTGVSAFKGNNHFIRNINQANSGLFADNTGATFADLTLLNVTAKGGALAGSVNTNVTNVAVKNAAISGEDYVGGLVGYAYASFVNCKVIDSTVVATNKEAGGLVGYVATSSASADIKSNVVRNVSVYAGNRAGGLIGQANVNIKVCYNTVDNVTVGAQDTSTYTPNALISNALTASENIFKNTVTNADVIGTVTVVGSATEMKTAVDSGEKNIIVANAEFNEKLPLNSTVDATFVDCTIKGNNAWGYVNNATFEGCTFESGSEVAAIHFDKLHGELVVNNCVFKSGKVQIGTDGDAVATFNNCVFGETTSTSIWAEKGMRFYAPTTFNNCEFNNRVVVAGSNDLSLIFNNCTMEGGKPVYYVDNTDGIIRGGNIPDVTVQ